MFTKILLATDGSEGALTAARFLGVLAWADHPRHAYHVQMLTVLPQADEGCGEGVEFFGDHGLWISLCGSLGRRAHAKRVMRRFWALLLRARRCRRGDEEINLPFQGRLVGRAVRAAL